MTKGKPEWDEKKVNRDAVSHACSWCQFQVANANKEAKAVGE